MLIGETELRIMKPDAILINSARGAIIDEQALVRAVKEKWIAGLGLDVFSLEPLNCENHPMRSLLDCPNVILSPHLTFYTEGAMERLETETLERCFEFLEGRNILIKSEDPRLRAQTERVVFL